MTRGKKRQTKERAGPGSRRRATTPDGALTAHAPLQPYSRITSHQVGAYNGTRVTKCHYTVEGESEFVALGRARTRCPRCGAILGRL
jgi:hypothetical protein